MPGESRIAYAQLSRYMSLWFGSILGLSPAEFRKQFGTQSGRSGGASAASNAGVAWELWGQHGAWASEKAQTCYMQKDVASLLSVSQAAMSLHPLGGSYDSMVLQEEEDIFEEAGFSIVDDEEQQTSELLAEGVPIGAFTRMMLD